MDGLINGMKRLKRLKPGPWSQAQCAHGLCRELHRKPGGGSQPAVGLLAESESRKNEIGNGEIRRRGRSAVREQALRKLLPENIIQSPG